MNATLDTLVRSASDASAEEWEAKRKQAFAVYAEIVARRNAPRPDDGKKILAALEYVFPLDLIGTEYYVPKEDRPGARYRLYCKDIAALAEAERIQENIDGVIQHVVRLADAHAAYEKAFVDDRPRLRAMEYMVRSHEIDRHERNIRQAKAELDDMTAFVRVERRRLESLKQRYARIFTPSAF